MVSESEKILRNLKRGIQEQAHGARTDRAAPRQSGRHPTPLPRLAPPIGRPTLTGRLWRWHADREVRTSGMEKVVRPWCSVKSRPPMSAIRQSNCMRLGAGHPPLVFASKRHQPRLIYLRANQQESPVAVARAESAMAFRLRPRAAVRRVTSAARRP